MVEYMEELEEFFEIGKEIVCYTGPEDLLEKIRYYLKHEDKRRAIAEAGKARCLKDHTWQKRFQTFFQHAGLEKS
jgi:spore maturation protein CgeB